MVEVRRVASDNASAFVNPGIVLRCVANRARYWVERPTSAGPPQASARRTTRVCDSLRLSVWYEGAQLVVWMKSLLAARQRLPDHSAWLSGARRRHGRGGRFRIFLTGRTDRRREDPSSTTALEFAIAAAVPLVLVGGAGVWAVLSRRGGFAWLSHGYERVAWTTAFGSLAASAASATSSDDSSRLSRDHGSESTSDLLLAPAAAAALTATAGERLGSAVGRALFVSFAGIAVASAGAALLLNTDSMASPSDSLSSAESKKEASSREEALAELTTKDISLAVAQRGSSALQATALILLPAMHLACPPVYTMSSEALMGLAWMWAAAGFARLGPEVVDEWSGGELTPEAMRNLLLAVGASSALRTLVGRRPLCQF